MVPGQDDGTCIEGGIHVECHSKKNFLPAKREIETIITEYNVVSYFSQPGIMHMEDAGKSPSVRSLPTPGSQIHATGGFCTR